MEETKVASKNRIVAVTYDDGLKYGCVNCGCGTILDSGIFGVGVCEECGQRQMFFSKKSDNVNVKFKDDSGEYYTPEIQKHPREGVPWHPYEWPDPKPEGGGEYWSPRGIGYDLSGFVKSKAAGERILVMVKEVLGIESPKSWLDYRPHEPKWIQFKFQSAEFNLAKLESLVVANNGVLTKDILGRCVIRKHEKNAQG